MSLNVQGCAESCCIDGGPSAARHHVSSLAASLHYCRIELCLMAYHSTSITSRPSRSVRHRRTVTGVPVTVAEQDVPDGAVAAGRAGDVVGRHSPGERGAE